jgi:hypothetical protein
MFYTMGDFEPTKYQAWINPALKKSRMALKALAVKVDMDYTALWKIARGNPTTYPGSSRPEYVNAVKIGEVLGDVEGSLRAANYLVDDTQPEHGNEPTAAQVVEMVLSLSPENRAWIMDAAARLSRVSR